MRRERFDLRDSRQMSVTGPLVYHSARPPTSVLARTLLEIHMQLRFCSNDNEESTNASNFVGQSIRDCIYSLKTLASPGVNQA